MSQAAQRFSLRDAGLRIDAMPPSGRDVTIIPDGEERLGLAAALGIGAVEHLTITLHAVRFRGGIRVTGRLIAAVMQPSVVTFEPVPQAIDEPIDRVFLPEREKPFATQGGAEIFVDLDGDDLPDHFSGGEADLSDLIFETIALALDPYPRAPGESLDGLSIPLADEQVSPFAALAGLKGKTDKQT